MSKYYTGTEREYGKQIKSEEFVSELNNGIPIDSGVLLDCFLPDCRSKRYPTGISKPIPLLQAIEKKDYILLLMVEYQLYIPKVDKKRELGLKLAKDQFKFYSNEETLHLIYKNKQEIRLDLSNCFDFSYQFSLADKKPKLDFWSWAIAPFS